MRAGVWWSAAALALLVVASAQRTAQEGTARISRRPTSPAPDTRIEAEAQSTFRPRGSRRREEVPPREVNTRTRSRPTETPVDSEKPQPQRNERFELRRTNSRARPRPAEEESKDITHPLPRRDSVIRSRGRQGSRSTLAPSLSTPASIELSSPTIDETKIEVVNSNLGELSKLTSKAEESTPKQFRRRGPTQYNAESTSKKPRGRVTSRTKSGDLEVSGTTNSLYREHTTPRSGDFKATRKLRYRSRLLETDSNTTGEELTAYEVKSSQNKETATSQPEIQTAAPIVVADMSNSAQSSSEAASIKSTTEKITKVVRRPLKRGKMNLRPTVSLPKLIKPDEISEDDNYPESFKALIQAKNASTQSSSPSSESLTVKASQRVYKTLTSSAQSTNTGPTKNKYARYRSKINAEENKEKGTETKDKSTESTPVPDQPKTRPPQYRPRNVYNPRNRKSSTFSTSTTPSSVSSSQGTANPVYKFNRKFKVTTTTAAPNNDGSIKSKRIESNNLVKKSPARPSYYSRRKNISSTESAASDTETVEKKEVNAISNTPILPKTSYYSRLRNKPKIDVASTVETITEPYVVQTPAEKKNENSIDMPLIFSLLNNKPDTEVTKPNSKETVPDKEMFIIAVTSKESSENSTENEVNKAEDNDNKPSTLDPTQKYHAMYTDNLKVATPMIQDQITSTSTPPIRNIQTRKYNGRKNVKPNENRDELQGVTPKPKERNSRKFSDTYTKSTEPSTNGIPPDPDKHKSRFSSKYRASYLDKPFYKPTVPTITPSTAWLKFFITDHELAKSLEDPYWFSAEDIFVTTQMSKLDVTPPPTNHETSLELVEGEEFQIGPDMNAIAFTMPRSPLSSADLKLSESLVKPSQIQNVEASQHSASVTVSIFDALADILTSTPRTPRLSSTTEVTQKQTTITDSKQTLNGVSNSINVNTVRNSSTSPVTDVNLTIKSVQTTYQTTPNVNNRLSVGESATQSLNTEGENITPVNTQTILTSTPTTPTTPVSARRPFAIRVLYSDTEPPTDKPTTATPSKSIQPSTDSPTTVYNTVSDLLLTNKNLVSSELTSMLSNNIKSLMQNMDENTRLKVSGRMAKLLNSIIPRAVNGLETANDDVDSGLNTTPYSLEEIKDTENVDVDKNTNKSDVDIDNFLQTVESVQNVVNSTIQDMSTGVTANAALAVNSPNDTFRQTGSTLSLPSSQTTLFGSTTISTTPSQTNEQSINNDSSSDSLGRAMTDNSPNVNIPLPFFTNAIVKELIPEDADDYDNQETTRPDLLPLSTQPITSSLSKNVVDLQYPSNVSPLQLWVLSKKARVLQMIEDLIRQHNDELATVPPLTEMFSQENNIPLSNRLTEIINTMTSTTESPSLRTEALPTTSPSSTPIISTISTPFPIFTFPVQTDPTTIKNPSTTLRSTTTKTTTVASNDFASTIEKIGTEIFSRFGIASAFTTTESPSRVPSTTPMTSSTENSNDSFQSTSTVVNTAQSTSEAMPETTTASADVETTTSNIETTTATVDIETTTQVEVENTTISTNEINQSVVSISNRLNINTSKVPKKDYVIFGILPNNTVVRKDPNDDVLEQLTEASPYIVYGVLPNNTIIRRFPNGTRVPRVMQKIDILPISPWSLRNPYSPIHNNPAIVRPQSNPIRVSTNTVTSTDINNGTENVTNDTVNNLQQMIPTSALNIKHSSSFGVTTAINKLPAEKSTASHVLSLRTTTMLPSVDEILLNSISSAAKEEMVISSMTSSTHEPRILTLDIDPETQQIRTEKPSEGDGSAVFKFIPIDEVMVAPQDSNVLKLASSKATTSNTNSPSTPSTAQTVTEINTQTPQIQIQTTGEIPTSVQVLLRTSGTLSSVFTNMPSSTTESFTFPSVATTPPTTTVVMTTLPPTTTSEPIIATTEATTQTLTTTSLPTTTTQATTIAATTVTSLPTTTNLDDQKYLEDAKLLEHLFQATERSPKSLNAFSNINQVQSDSTTSSSSTTQFAATYPQSEEAKILQAILAVNQRPNTLTIPNIGGSIRVTTGTQTTTTARSIEDEIRQFEEDTKLLKALLAATGQNPAGLNIPSLDSLNIPTRATTPATTTVRQTTTVPTTSTARVRTTTPSFEDDLKQFNEDTQLLQALLQATGQKSNSAIPPVISGVTSNVRIASNPLTTSIGSNPTTPINIRPVYTSRTTTPLPPVFTSAPSTLPIFTTLQPRTPTATTEAIVSTTYVPTGRRRQPTTTTRSIQATLSGRRAPVTSTTITTEVPSTSTFSDQEDLLFLQNLKSALNTNTNGDDPESDLANRIIALAVEKSLNEIQTNQQANDGRTGKSLGTTVPYRVPTTTTIRTTTPTTTTTTTTPRPTTTTIANTPSLEDDIKQFQEDTKLLQALLKATGQDPSQFNIPTFPSTNVKGVQETTTQRNKLTITGQSPDEALQKLIQQTKPTGMVSEATKAPISISTEFGKSNDALLAALLKEQGFGPTTASSLDEQLRLAALLNQVVVTPKARRTTTEPPPPPPPPPAQRRPVLDGLAWLWQQWRETAPGPTAARPNRRPAPSAAPAAPVAPAASSATSNRLNWFGSGPFVGNADDAPPANRIPLEPPRTVTAEQTPGRGQLVSAAINVTRAFSQFLGAAIQGAAQTVQNVIRAGQRAATDVYTNGSG